MVVEIKIKSSSGGSYTVNVVSESGLVSLHCDCPAGSIGQMCKHKSWVISNDTSCLADDSQIVVLEQAVALLEETAIPTVFRETQSLLDELEAEEASLKKRAKSLKRELARKLGSGFPIGRLNEN